MELGEHKMDKLLKQQPQPLADEKTELFSLMDRFIASIEGYRKEYDTILASKTARFEKERRRRKKCS